MNSFIFLLNNKSDFLKIPDQIEDVIYLKRRNRDLKVLMSIGGYSSLSANFSKMVETSTSRANFIRTTIAAIEKYGFDGLDLLWEYPGGSDKVTRII